MAFLVPSPKENAYYLVHNVRPRAEKVAATPSRAFFGDRARITDDVVKEVSKKHPFIDLNWRSLREQLDNQIDLADPSIPGRPENSFRPSAISIFDLAESLSPDAPAFRIARGGAGVAPPNEGFSTPPFR